jgi:secretion/DNA translocation related CpaE-like protein
MSVEVLVVSTDVMLVDDVLRLTAAVGRHATTVASLDACGPLWQAARLVVVGADVAADPMPARDRVVMVGYEAGATSAVWQAAHVLQAQHVVVLPDAESWLLEQFDDLDAHRRAQVVAVVGARGGAGASVLAVALACAGAAQQRSVLLLDADSLGGGIDLAIGCEGVAGTRWPDLANRTGRLPAATLTQSLPQRHGVHVLSFDRGVASDDDVAPAAAAAVLEAARRSFDVVIVDLPRAATALARVAHGAADSLLLITPRDVRSVAAASLVAAHLPSGLLPQLVTRGPAPGGLAVSDICRILQLPAVGDVPYDKTLPATLERGVAPGSVPRSPLARAAARLLDRLGDAAPVAA